MTTPASSPASKHPMNASVRLFVAPRTSVKIVMPNAITDGNDRSISAAMITNVKGSAIMAKNGVVDMNA